ncbi:uncharacterized protein isoform X1 [Choristoneura fumiferana]|uniref:uncharacterized protein isoform X1 n=1 Tax=Choristoneura fumiferana TaxID=7141 RepID=UPI003D15596F
MEKELKKLVAKRGYLKASLTRIFNAVDRADQEPLSPALAQTKIEKRALALESVDQGTSKQCDNVVVNAAYQRDTERQMSMRQCIHCKSNHKLFTCAKFKLLPVNDRLAFVKSKALCPVCLNSHPGKCRYHFKCNHCKDRSHNSLLHVNTPAIASGTVTLASSIEESQCLLPTARVYLVGQDGTKYNVKVLLDSGSQVSFVTTELVQRLGLTPVQKEVTIVGITNVNNKVNYSIPLEVYSRISPFKLSVNCHVVDSITCKLPQTKLDMSNIYIPPGIQLADNDYNIPGEIHMLMGCDAFFQLLLPQQPALARQSSAQHSVQPTIINTHFGHVIGGSLPLQQQACNKTVSLHCQVCKSDNDNINETLQTFWKTEDVPEIFKEQASETDLCEEIFQNTVQLSNNQFQVDLPLKLPLEHVNDTLGKSFELALSRFLNLEKKLSRFPDLLEQYKQFIQEYIDLGHGHYVDIETMDLNKDAVYFLPHRAVINENSKSTKTRVVFDGSLKTNKKISLNNLLLNGALMQKDLFQIMLLFRLGDYTFTTDIRRMFRAIALNPIHTSLQNILWRDDPSEPIRCIRLDTVTYGLKSSTFLATRCLFELASRYEHDYPLAAFIIRNCSYVDDVLYCDSDITTVLEAKRQLRELLMLGGFNTHKWSSNHAPILSDIPPTEQHFDELDLQRDNHKLKALGLTIDNNKDCFTISCPETFNSQSVTKRDILSYISKFYDPMGFVSPIIVKAKAIMQRLWSEQIDWDATPSNALKSE